MGEFVLMAITTTLAMIVLLTFYHIERAMASSIEERTYMITTGVDWSKFKALKNVVQDHGLEIMSHKQEKHGKTMVVTFELMGSTQQT